MSENIHYIYFKMLCESAFPQLFKYLYSFEYGWKATDCILLTNTLIIKYAQFRLFFFVVAICICLAFLFILDFCFFFVCFDRSRNLFEYIRWRLPINERLWGKNACTGLKKIKYEFVFPFQIFRPLSERASNEIANSSQNALIFMFDIVSCFHAVGIYIYIRAGLGLYLVGP